MLAALGAYRHWVANVADSTEPRLLTIGGLFFSVPSLFIDSHAKMDFCYDDHRLAQAALIITQCNGVGLPGLVLESAPSRCFLPQSMSFLIDIREIRSGSK